MQYVRFARRLLARADAKALWKMGWNLGLGGANSVRLHKRRMRRGEFFPPFLYVSVINSCNLRCQGCWVDVAHDRQIIDLPAMDKLIGEAKAMGNRFFGLVGGEPFMHPDLLEIPRRHQDCYFQIFTNGQFITAEKAQAMRRLANVTPLISVEGNETVSDERRGRTGVYNKTLRGIRNCLDNRVPTGVCTSVAANNFDDLVSDAWLDKLIGMGVLYTWFHVYRPMGPDAGEEQCLSRQQQKALRQFVVSRRASKPIAIIDAYHDGEGRALCPAVTGVSHHINPWGDIEPCPIVQFSKEGIHAGNRGGADGRSLREKFLGSEYLTDFRQTAAAATRGCIVLERPDLLKAVVERHAAEDSTARRTAMAELEAMTARTSQYHPGDEVPEKSLAYRLAKRYLFSDFGVYDGHDHTATAAPYLLKDAPPAPAKPAAELVQLTV